MTRSLRGREAARDRQCRTRPPGHRLVRRGHRPPRPRPSRCRAARLRDRLGDRGPHPGAHLPRARLRIGGRCVFSRGALRQLRSPLGRAPGGHGGGGARTAQGGSAGLRVVEGQEAGRGHLVGFALGTRAAGMAHRVFGDGGKAPGRGVRHPRRRTRSALSPSRKRARPVPWRRAAIRPDLDAQRHDRAPRREMSKSIGNIVSLREAFDRWGREAVLVFFLGGHYRSALQYSDATMQSARAQADDFRQAVRVAAARPSDLTWNSFADALDDDFDTPRALAVLHGWRAAGQLGLLSRGLDVFGLAIDTPGAVAPPDALRLAEARRAARARRDYAEADRLRAEIERLGWELQDGADGVRLIPKVR